MQQLTRKRLIELHKSFDCNQWRDRIASYLSSSQLEGDDFKVDIKDDDIKYATDNAQGAQKTLLKKVGIKLLESDLLERIKTMNDVWKALNINPNDVLPYKETSTLTKKQKSLNAVVKIQYISELFNEGWVPNFQNTSEYKYYIWFRRNSSGPGWVYDSGYFCGGGSVGFGFYFRTSQIATYIGKQFIDIFNDYLPE